MKFDRVLGLILLVVAIPVASFAAKNSKEITLDQTTKVGSTELQAGTYRVTWDGSGPQVEVDFSQNRKTVASSTANLVNARSDYPSAVQVRTESDNSTVLEEIDFNKMKLVFPQSESPSGN